MFRNRENQIALLSILALIIVALFYTKPAINAYLFKRKEIKRYNQVLTNKNVSRRDILEIKKDISQVETDIEKLRAQLPTTENRGILIKDLETLASKHGIEIENFLPKETMSINYIGQAIDTKTSRRRRKKNQDPRLNEAKAIKTLIELDSKGTFEEYVNFLADLKQYYRAVDITNITMNRGTNTGGSSNKKTDARFTTKRSRGNKLANAKGQQQLSVNFVLIAFTSLPNIKTLAAKQKLAG